MIGAGIIGLAVADALLARGHAVMLVDPDPEGDKASHGNAGGIAAAEILPAAAPGVFLKVPRWLADPEGPLAIRWRHLPALLPWLTRFARMARPAEAERVAEALAALNRPTFDDLGAMLERNGLSGLLHRAGALTIYETDRGFAAEQGQWAVRRRLGFGCEMLTGEAARQMEPALGPAVRHAVYMPDWGHVSDPRAVHLGLLESVLGRGAALRRARVTRIVPAEGGVRAVLEDGSAIGAAQAVLAAGAWSAALARALGDRVLLESERGYNATLPDPGLSLGREIALAERKFVVTPLAPGLRIGGAAEFGGLEARPNWKRSDRLVTLAARILPGLRSEGARRWAGHRPSTPDSLPVIGRSPGAPRVIHAFGHGHLGLTQAASTARIVADLIGGRPSPITLEPYGIERFGKGGMKCATRSSA